MKTLLKNLRFLTVNYRIAQKNERDLSELMGKHVEALLTKKERKAIDSYVTDWAIPLNRYLRRESYVPPIHRVCGTKAMRIRKMEREAQLLDQALRKMPLLGDIPGAPEKITAYRGLRHYKGGSSLEIAAREFAVGTYHHDPGFQSFSMIDKAAMGFTGASKHKNLILRLTFNRAWYTGYFNLISNEYDFILPRNTLLSVAGHTTEIRKIRKMGLRKITFVDLEVVNVPTL